MVKSKTSKKTSKYSQSALAICPTEVSGWCSYPFSPAQLEKRLKAKQMENEAKAKATKKKSK